MFALLRILFFLLSFEAFASAQAGSPSKLVPLPVVYSNLSMGSAPIWVIDKAGIFRKHGLDVSLTLAQGNLPIQAMIAGSFDIGFVGAVPLIGSVLSGAQLKLTATMFDKILYGLATSRDITSGSQLKGKRIGISRAGTTSEMAARYAVSEVGLDPDRDVTMIQVGNSPERFIALRAGSIQGMAADPSDMIRAQREGFPILVDLTRSNIDFVVGGVVMTERFIRDQEKTALAFLRAYVEGLHYFKTHPEESSRVAATMLRTSDLDALRQSWKVYERITPRKPYPSLKGLEPVIRLVAVRNPAALNAKPEQFIDSRFIEQIDKSGFIDRLYR
jgi:NitT/TauT family transport system substrate-binding protein